MGRVVAHWRAEDFILLTSPSTRADLAQGLAHPSIQDLTARPLAELVQGLEQFSEPVAGTLDLSGACRNPRSDALLACAVEGEAHYLVTTDRGLLRMRNYQDLCIVTPVRFLLALQLHKLPVEEISHRFPSQTLHRIVSAMCLDPTTEAKLNQVLGGDQEVRDYAARHSVPESGSIRRLARQLRDLVMGR